MRTKCPIRPRRIAAIATTLKQAQPKISDTIYRSGTPGPKEKAQDHMDLGLVGAGISQDDELVSWYISTRMHAQRLPLLYAENLLKGFVERHLRVSRHLAGARCPAELLGFTAELHVYDGGYLYSKITA